MENHLAIKDKMVVWTQPTNQETPVFLKHTKDYVSLLYVKKIKKDIYVLSINELIGYINCCGLNSLTILKYQKQRYDCCGICGQPGNCNYYTSQHLLSICDTCYFTTNYYKSDISDNDTPQQQLPISNIFHFNKIYYNHRTGNSNTFEDLVDAKIDITVNYDNHIYYHYRLTYKYDCYVYDRIIYQPWYNYTYLSKRTDQKCIRCKVNHLYKQGYCQTCIDYAYQISFKHVIIAWLSLKDDYIGDILCIIFKKLLRLLNYYNIDKMKILTIYNPAFKNLQLKNIKEIKEEIKKEDYEKDLITEDNMYSYVKFDLNELSSDENYDDLCNDFDDVLEVDEIEDINDVEEYEF